MGLSLLVWAGQALVNSPLNMAINNFGSFWSPEKEGFGRISLRRGQKYQIKRKGSEELGGGIKN